MKGSGGERFKVNSEDRRGVSTGCVTPDFRNSEGDGPCREGYLGVTSRRRKRLRRRGYRGRVFPEETGVSDLISEGCVR